MKLTTQAYCKMVLHGAKYPHCAVNGLLVAERPPGSRGREQAGPPSLFVDCIPLFHGTLALAPMLEVALTLVRPWLGGREEISAWEGERWGWSAARPMLLVAKCGREASVWSGKSPESCPLCSYIYKASLCTVLASCVCVGNLLLLLWCHAGRNPSPEGCIVKQKGLFLPYLEAASPIWVSPTSHQSQNMILMHMYMF